MTMPVKIRILSRQQVSQILNASIAEVLDVVENAFIELGNGRALNPEHGPMWLQEDRSAMLMAMPSYLSGAGVAGVKWINFFEKRAQNFPASYGNLLILSGADDGQPRAIMEASDITAMRTGGGHGVICAKYLAKESSNTLAVIGCGEEARAGIRGYLEAFPNLKRLHIFDIRKESMANIVEEFGSRINVSLCMTAREAVLTADIILMATTARNPVVMFEWLNKGAFVSGMYSFNDLDPECSRKSDKWVLGSKITDGEHIVSAPQLRKYNLSMDDVYGDLGEVVTGKIPGRENDTEIIVYTCMGMGSLDVALGAYVYERAVEQNIGTIIDMG